MIRECLNLPLWNHGDYKVIHSSQLWRSGAPHSHPHPHCLRVHCTCLPLWLPYSFKRRFICSATWAGKHRVISGSVLSLSLHIQSVGSEYVCVCVHTCAHHTLSHVQLFQIPWTVVCQAPLSVEFSSKNTGLGCHFFLQGIFPTRGWNPQVLCLLHWQLDSLLLHHLGSPHSKVMF